jgi:hypothetical protein
MIANRSGFSPLGTSLMFPRRIYPQPVPPAPPGNIFRQSPAWLQKNLLPLSTGPKNRTSVGVSIKISAPSYHDGPAWPCTGPLCPCICRPPPGKHHLNDHPVIANANLTSKPADEVYRSIPTLHGTPAQSRNHRESRGRSGRPLEGEVLTT